MAESTEANTSPLSPRLWTRVRVSLCSFIFKILLWPFKFIVEHFVQNGKETILIHLLEERELLIRNNLLALLTEIHVLLKHREKMLPYSLAVGKNYESSKDGHWRILPLRVNGYDVVENKRLFIKSMALIKLFPDCISASYILLDSGKKVGLHQEGFKGVLRLIFPVFILRGEKKAWVESDEKEYEVEAGKAVILDPSQPHGYHNDTDGTLLLLCLDFYRTVPLGLKGYNRLLVVLSRYSHCYFHQYYVMHHCLDFNFERAEKPTKLDKSIKSDESVKPDEPTTPDPS